MNLHTNDLRDNNNNNNDSGLYINGTCKYNYNQYFNVCKFINKKQNDNDEFTNEGNKYTMLNTISTTKSMNDNDIHSKWVQPIKPHCYHRKLHSLYVINNNNISISRNHISNNNNNMCNRSLDISNLKTKDGSRETISYFINNLHNTSSSSNEDKLSFLTSQK